MKFLRTFFSNTEAEVEAVRKFIPDAPVFASAVSHGPVAAAPSRIDLYRTARPCDTGEQPFCVYERDEHGALATDYVASSEQPTAVKGKGRRKPKGYVEQTLAAMLPEVAA